MWRVNLSLTVSLWKPFPTARYENLIQVFSEILCVFVAFGSSWSYLTSLVCIEELEKPVGLESCSRKYKVQSFAASNEADTLPCDFVCLLLWNLMLFSFQRKVGSKSALHWFAIGSSGDPIELMKLNLQYQIPFEDCVETWLCLQTNCTLALGPFHPTTARMINCLEKFRVRIEF